MLRPGSGFQTAFTRDLVDLELGPLDASVRDGAVAWVSRRFAAAGDVTRLGLAATGALLGALVVVTSGSTYARLPAERRRAVASRLAATKLPLAGEYVKAVRALATSYVYEARFASWAP